MRTDYDYTMMSMFLTCRRRYYYRMARNLSGKVEHLAPLFGQWIHKALDSWYKDRDIEKAVGLFRDGFKERLDEDDKRTHAVGEWILRNYDEKYRDQPFKVLETEREFCLPLPNGNNLIGRMDKVIEWDGAIWVMDHKTTSSLGPQFMKMHTPNMQFDGYFWAARKLGYPKCQGVLVDGILVAKGLLESSSRARLTPLVRDFAYRTENDFIEYENTVAKIQGDIQLCESDPLLWYPNYDACTYYGECPYRKICKEPVEIRERVIEADYVEHAWDPRSKQGNDD